jgi:hypothetical protein
MLMALAFVSPRSLAAIVDGHARVPPVTTLILGISHSWKEQERVFI